MKRIHPFKCLKTSVSLPDTAYRRLCAGRKIFARNGIYYSEQEIYRRLLKYYLKNWRGRGLKTNRTRRYNADGKSYQVHSLYVNQVLYAALWQRALHSGESISRMLDCAIRVYLPRLLEGLLGQPNSRGFLSVNSAYWAHRYQRRKVRYSDFFINYVCETLQNDAQGLEYSQKLQILHKSDLSLMQIWEMLNIAA